MSRQFTWWRRFWATRKMPKQMLYKAASELQQRIEFGEYEVDNLGREYMLEELIFEKKEKALRKEKPWLTEESYREQIQPINKQYRKRQNLIMKAHLEAEQKLLYKLREELDKEFGIGIERIQDEMEVFDGTTREFYFHIKSIALGKKFDPRKQQRLIPEQPRHILKPKERKYVDLWMKLVKKNKWEEFLNWNNYQ